MRSAFTSITWLPLLAAGALVWPIGASAQAFSADYGLAASNPPPTEPLALLRTGLFKLGSVGFGPALRADARFSGAGLSVTAGQNWFAQVAVGRSLQQVSDLPGTSADALSIAGGYRWSNGQSLSLQVTGSRGADRLGLSVGYDWPRYFLRLSYDSRLNLVPVETLRFSAGMRF